MTAAPHSPVGKASDLFGKRRQRRAGNALMPRDDFPKSLEDSDTSLDFFSFESSSVHDGAAPLESLSSHNCSSLIISNQSSGSAFNNSGLTRVRNDRRNDLSSRPTQYCYSEALPPLGVQRQNPPPKETTCTPGTSFKIDGVPACVSQQIEENARISNDKRKKKKHKQSLADLHNSASALQSKSKKQRPQIKFLDLPMDHPLYWDKNELKTADFPEKDREFLARVLKNPQSTAVGGHPLSPRVEQILLKLHHSDWDASILGRSAMVLFHPDSNPLGLSPLVTGYFFKRINSLKTILLMEAEMPVLEYRGRCFQSEESLGDFAIMLRKDFAEATRNYEAYQSILF